MWNQYATPLRIELGFSRSSLGLIGLAWLCAVVSLLTISNTYFWAIFITIPATLFVLRTVQMDILRSRAQSISQLIWKVHNQCELCLCDGTRVTATLLPFWYVSSWFIILHTRDVHGKRRSMLIGRDAVTADNFRRLRVRLRLAGAV